MTSLKTVEDLADITVSWIPTQLFLGHYTFAFRILGYLQGLLNSLTISVPAAIGQIVAGSFVGYGLARMPFPGREALFFLVLFTFLIPPQTIVVPLFTFYRDLGWLNTYYPFIVPPFLGFGVKGALFILIFRQFFRGLPWELEDAALIDGASPLRVYWRVMLPLASPAILVVLLFSLVWHWNDYFQSNTFLLREEKFTLPMRLATIAGRIQQTGLGYSTDDYNEGLMMAATVLVILPMLLFYALAQRYFVESVDRTGLVE